MSYKNINPKEAKKELDRNTVFIDIREDWERELGYIPRSKWIPLAQLNERHGELAGEKAVIYCEHGIRSSHVLSILFDMGYSNLINLEGGFDAWKQQGFPDGRKDGGNGR